MKKKESLIDKSFFIVNKFNSNKLLRQADCKQNVFMAALLKPAFGAKVDL